MNGGKSVRLRGGAKLAPGAVQSVCFNNPFSAASTPFLSYDFSLGCQCFAVINRSFLQSQVIKADWLSRGKLTLLLKPKHFRVMNI